MFETHKDVVKDRNGKLFSWIKLTNSQENLKYFLEINEWNSIPLLVSSSVLFNFYLFYKKKGIGIEFWFQLNLRIFGYFSELTEMILFLTS